MWIPRYAYKIINGYHEDTDDGKIDIKFLPGTGDKPKEGDNTPIQTNGYIVNDPDNDTSNNYFLHPAFKFGNDDIPGFWVAKFSPSNDGNDNVKIVSNATIWRDIKVSEAFNLCREMETKTDIYGWPSNEVDTHMMKNIEWGAVAYLSKSQYGAAANKVWNNSFTSYRTGCSGDDVDATSSSDCVAYNTTNGVKASTTFNIYGVYDMRGGAWEYVMGNLLNGQGKRQDKSAGFDNIDEIDNKYIDEYTGYESNKYGDAIYETCGKGAGTTSWDGAYSVFVSTSNPWFKRGGHNSNSYSGVFYFDYVNGYSLSNYSFRPVVVYSVGN